MKGFNSKLCMYILYNIQCVMCIHRLYCVIVYCVYIYFAVNSVYCVYIECTVKGLQRNALKIVCIISQDFGIKNFIYWAIFCLEIFWLPYVVDE